MGRLRHIKGAEEAVENSPYVIHYPMPEEGYFEIDNPLHIEIGMGKGRFIMEMAEDHPDINFIGVERYESVLLKAIQKYDRLLKEGTPLTNICFLCEDAENMAAYFKKESVDKIYLNFSDPWPKDRHAHRRLVSEKFLKLFHEILSDNGLIEFKTDNNDLFDYALTQYKEAGYSMIAFTRDLHADEDLCEGNVMTEYEEKFSSRGNRINKLIIQKNPGSE